MSPRTPRERGVTDLIFQTVCDVMNVAPDGSAKTRVKANLLTPREREVLNLRKTGMTAQEIGAALGISYRTVKCHTWRATKKLGAANTAHAVYLATKEGIID